jgi:hypothetical protein
MSEYWIGKDVGSSNRDLIEVSRQNTPAATDKNK